LFQQTADEYRPEDVDADFAQPANRTDLLLSFNAEALAIATLDDFGDGRAAMRGVAVREDRQGEGHGRALGRLIGAFAKSHGIAQLCVNADPEKTGYYASLGFSEEIWSEEELADSLAGRAWPMPVQMVKTL
jgi:N-acetylglutamate synthase-like GNAT family acetyltransferase